MRKRSVKVKITLWYLLLMGLMAGLMLVFLRLIAVLCTPKAPWSSWTRRCGRTWGR